jgi:hypothetical protein
LKVFVSKKTLTPLPEYRREVMDGYMTPIFEGMNQALNRLMWDFIVLFPAHTLGLVGRDRASRRRWS